MNSKNKIMAVIATIAIMSMVIFSGCSNTSNDLQSGYYKDVIIKPNGEFIAIEKISDEKVANSGMAYKVEMNKDNKVEKISAMYGGKLINLEFKDTLLNWHGDVAVIALEYQDGYIKYTFKDALMQPVNGFYGANSVRYKLNDKNIPVMAYFYNKEGEQSSNNAGFAQMLFTYDDKDNLTKIGFADKNGERVATNLKQYEIHLKYQKNKGDYPSEVSYHSKGGDLAVDSRGIAKIKYAYDEKNKMTEIRFFGSDDNLKEISANKVNVNEVLKGAGAIIKIKWTEKVMKISFFGKDEQPLGIKLLNNIAAIEYQYNDREIIESIKGYGTDGEARSFNTKEKNIVLEKYQYDDVGNLIQTSFYNKDGNLVACNADPQYAISKTKYDEKRRVIENSYFGTNEEPIEVRDEHKKFHRKYMEYDDDGKITAAKFYDKNDNEITAEPNKSLVNEISRDFVNGEWDSGKGINTLTLNLRVEGNQVIGAHYATWNNASKLDGSKDQQTLSGGFNGKSIFTVNFKSDFGGTGVARISIIDRNTMEWKIISKSGQVYIPNSIRLTKK